MADLCSELGITRQTLYRRVAPDGALRKDGLKVVEGGKTGNQHRKKQGDRRCLPRFSVQLLLLRPLIRRSSACGSAYLSQFLRSKIMTNIANPQSTAISYHASGSMLFPLFFANPIQNVRTILPASPSASDATCDYRSDQIPRGSEFPLRIPRI